MTIEPPVIVGGLTLMVIILGAVIKNAVSIAAAQTRATAAEEKATLAEARVVKVADELNSYRVAAASTFASNASLKLVEDRLTSAIHNFSSSLDRLTDRLDRLLTLKEV